MEVNICDSRPQQRPRRDRAGPPQMSHQRVCVCVCHVIRVRDHREDAAEDALGLFLPVGPLRVLPPVLVEMCR